MKNDSDSIRSGVKRDFPAAPIYGLPIELVGIGWADIVEIQLVTVDSGQKDDFQNMLTVDPKGPGGGGLLKASERYFFKNLLATFPLIKISSNCFTYYMML